MNKVYNIFYTLLIVGLISTSCNTDFLDTTPSDKLSELSVFGDHNLTETYVNGIYTDIKHPFAGRKVVMKAEFVDEAHDMWYNFYEFNNCMMTSDDDANWLYEDWDYNYSNIRKCNLFFKNFDEDVFESEEVGGVSWSDRLKGEAHFLRAFFYHQLVSLYGGVPIITKIYDLNDDFKVARNTYEECIDFIVAECDSAASFLPVENTDDNVGRATKGAALALKSEVLLYAASELHNNNTVFSGYSNPEYLGYVSGNAQDRWSEAKDAAKAVIDLGTYDLYTGTSDSLAQNYNNLFIASETTEDIFVRYFLEKSGRSGNGLPLGNGTNGYHCYGQNTPTGNIVDAYEMADGTRFDWNNPECAAEPYKNRDPRFYASVLYEGVNYKERPEDVQAYDPVGIIQVGTWETWNATTNEMEEVYGLDSRNSVIEPYNGGYTGYYLRKFVDPSVDGQYTKGQSVPWRYLRYTEILLNYAEACIELGEDAEARTYINKIRERVGMPDINESGDELRELYRNERRVELAFEDKRFYDVRRWATGSDGYQDATGVDVRYELDYSTHTTATVPAITPITVQSRSWNDKAYFFPISRDEINRNSLLVQNPGY
jgi:hypothetical protein